MAKKPVFLVIGLALLGLSGGAAVAAHMSARQRFNGRPFRGPERSVRSTASATSSDPTGGYDVPKDDGSASWWPFAALGLLESDHNRNDQDDRGDTAHSSSSDNETSHSYASTSSYDSSSSYSSDSSSSSGYDSSSSSSDSSSSD